MAPELDQAPPDPHPLLTMSAITKSFPGVRALDGVDLDVEAGEVHCLLGQNGAGKSTLIKVLAGAHQPDGGEILWNGSPVSLKSPVAAMRLGIATIYQELDLVEGLSVAENVYPRGRHGPPPRPSSAGSATRRSTRAGWSVTCRRPGSRSCPWPAPCPTTYA
jgi:ABC-type sugar transport system ATPase subunit